MTKSIKRNRYFVFFILFGIWFWEVADVMADRIIMKDGTFEESDQIWESEKYIHFILKGTTSVEIRFLKDIVERVESNNMTFPAKTPDATSVQPDSDQTSPMKPMLATGQPPIVEASKQIPPHDQGPDDQLAKANKGISFYDPHREKRYWAERNAHFGTLDEALVAIAVRYQRPTDWVVDHMGEENDIGSIYANLNHRLSLELAEKPRHSLPGNQHSEHPEPSTHSQQEPSLPQDATGNTPDPMASAINSESNISKGAVRGFSNSQAVVLNSLNGIQFYDPRRPQKYWVGPNEKYDTLNAALKALAVHYNTTVQWVEDHIGNTNALSEIHENIRNSLQP